MELSEIRSQIDRIDDRLLPLFLERMELAEKVAAYKQAHGLPLLNKEREREIMAHVCAKSGALERYTHRLYTTLFELSRACQQSKLTPNTAVEKAIAASLERGADLFPQTGTVACQGVEGAYSQMAADRLFPRGNLMFLNSFEAVFDAVESGLCRFGVLPIENSSHGSVRAVYDLLGCKNVSIVRSTRLCIHHVLLAKPHTALSDITEIYSHEQALGQCSTFLKSLGDKVKIIPCDNTAAAAKMAASAAHTGVASISAQSCAELYGLSVVNDHIQNSDNNYTRFICIAKEPVVYAGANRISLILATSHRPGSLYAVLAQLAALEINLLKLESCPIAGSDFEFLFFLELEANVGDPHTAAMLGELERSAERLVYLGNYAEG